MLCPSCNTLNSATSVRCLQCRTLLIDTAVERSPLARQAQNDGDRRVYILAGSVVGLAVGGLIFQSGLAAVFFPGVGSLLGRWIAKRERDGR